MSPVRRSILLSMYRLRISLIFETVSISFEQHIKKNRTNYTTAEIYSKTKRLESICVIHLNHASPKITLQLFFTRENDKNKTETSITSV